MVYIAIFGLLIFGQIYTSSAYDIWTDCSENDISPDLPEDLRLKIEDCSLEDFENIVSTLIDSEGKQINLTSIKELKIQHDHTIKAIVKLSILSRLFPNLEKLEIRHAIKLEEDEDGIWPMNLTDLEISSVNENVALPVFKNSASLRYLTIEEWDNLNSVENLKVFENLEELEMNGLKKLERIEPFTNFQLKKLILKRIPLEKLSENLLKNLAILEELTIENAQDHELTMPKYFLANCQNLRILTLKNLKMDPNAISEENFQNLRNLTLNNVTLNNEIMSKMGNLKYLKLESTNISFLKNLPIKSLKELQIKGIFAIGTFISHS